MIQKSTAMHKLLKFEGKKQPLLDQRLYYNRVLRSILAGGLVITFFLLLGVVGYHFTCAFGWLDSLLNASHDTFRGWGRLPPLKRILASGLQLFMRW